MTKEKEPSEGELFILEYLKYNNIDFKREVKLENLKHDDNFTHRRVDFLLTKYNVYLEFNGLWNNTKADRERYRQKKEVYYKNNIPCIYLYPENLGIIEFVFPKRLIEILKMHNKKRELFRYQFKRLIDDRGNLFIWMFLAILFLSGDFTWEKDRDFILFMSGVLLYQVYRLIRGYYMFFVKNIIKF